MLIKEEIIEHLYFMTQMVSAPFYWLDLEGRFIGLNKKALEAIGAVKEEDVIGKTAHDLYPKELADSIRENIKEVLRTGKSSEMEDVISDLTTNKLRYFASTRSLLYDYERNIIGVLGTSIEITDTKEKDRLSLENQKYQIEKQQQEQFRKIVEQVVHDIRSPISTLKMILPTCNVLPEQIRLTVNKSVSRIQDIASNMLNQFKPHNTKDANGKLKYDLSLISSDILDVVAEKRYEYEQSQVDFITKISLDSHFTFVNINVKDFKRMLSNLINNAVDALHSSLGLVTINLNIENDQAKITIEDDGCGMPENIKQKILNDIAVTSGKEDGHGIGFKQIRDTLAANNGTMDIVTKLGKGTKVSVSFPVIITPDWLCDKIELKTDDLIVILDDDPSIHGAWEARFAKDAPNITLNHFEHADEAVKFINNLYATQKEKVFLLTDYELLRQELHGLDVINETKISRSVLVTSHHNNEIVRELANQSNTKILPKLLASEVTINITNTKLSTEKPLEIKTKLVIIDDDKAVVDTLVKYIFKDKDVDVYHTAKDFLNHKFDYPKDTKFLIDNQFKGEVTTGIEIAAKLFEQEYKELFLFSGLDFSQNGSLPDYIKFIVKDDIEALQRLM